MPKECFVSEELRPNSKDDIRNRVCDDLAVSHLYNGEYYCVLHFPDNNKHTTTDFDIVLNDRLKKQNNDFGHVYFSNEQNFESHNFTQYPSFLEAKFINEANFHKVNFPSGADFRYTVFKRKADFSFAKFQQSGTFYNAEFEGDVTFYNSFFREDATFKKTKFNQYAYFNRVEFNRKTEFMDAEFSQRATFYYTKFKYTDFSEAKFFADSSFADAIFSTEIFFENTKFKLKVGFLNTVFEEVSFVSTNFEDTCEFERSRFNKYAFFRKTKFKNALFWRSLFEDHSEVLFENIEFSKLEFMNCKFKNIFTIEENKLTTQNGKEQIIFGESFIKSPELISFKTITLRPNWFINIESRKLIFTDVRWKDIDILSSKQIVNKELKTLEKIENSKQLFKIACRQLAENAENNNRLEEASKFRRMAFETERLERKEKISNWWSRNYSCSEVIPSFWDHLKLLPYDFLHFAYRFSSYYGESSVRAFIVLTGIILIAAFLYWIPLSQFPDKETFRSLDFLESIFYSLRVMVLQRPEPFPANTFGKAVLALESVLAPVQLALLALAIRRKFMR